MTSENVTGGRIPEITIRRVAAVLDGSAGWQQRLDIAVGLSVRFEAELRGLYWLNSRLNQLCHLPFASELDVLTGAQRPLEFKSLQRFVRVQAGRIRQQLTSRAEQAGVAYSFQVVQGAALDTVLGEMRGGDLLIFGRNACASRGKEVQNAAIAVVFDRSERALAMLAVAADLAVMEQRPLRVLTTANKMGLIKTFEQQAAAWLRQRRLTAQFERIEDSGLEHVLALTDKAPPSLLVVDRARLTPSLIQRVERGIYPVALLH